MKGSMELMADRDPGEARKLLDPVLEGMMEAVHHYEGTVNQVMGDGIMALFGAPVAHEDHAVRACYAALRMQRRVNLYADELQRAGDTPVQIRVGLNSGEVIVRSIGSDLHMDYTAVGQTTHLAARIEQMAKPGTALVTSETLTLAEPYIQFKPLGAVTVEGVEAATQVYELIGMGSARSRLQASAARGLTRFVGREGELQQLAQALDRVAAGHGQIVAVVGEAGVGKSRLVWEFTRSHRTRDWLILESGSVSYGKATPYLPVAELLKSYFRIQDRDGQREIRERVAGKLLTLDRALEPLLPPLLGLLDVPVDDAAWNALDPPQRRRQTLEAVKLLLLRESQVQPLLVLFEDLHWIDSETQSLLDGLIESLPTSRVLLLVNYRPEYEHAWGGNTSYLQLRIDPLPLEKAEELLDALLGEDRTLEPLKRMLIERTEGNPFFLGESVRALVETGAFLGERGGYRLARPLPAIQVPATVLAVLAARIDRLPPGDKALLQVASVVGKDVSFALLQAIAEPAEDGLRVALGRLQAADFLYETSLFPDLEYTFKHALTHEVTYGSLLQDRRRALHARIVETIERLYPDRLPEHIERLGYHAFRGEVWDRAVGYLRQAGAKAMARSAHREARTSFEQALAALAHLPRTRETQEQAIDLRLEAREALLPVGETFERAIDHVREAAALAEALGDGRRLAWISVYTTLHFWGMGQPADAVATGRRAVVLARETGDLQLQAEAGTRLGMGCHALGDYGQAIECLERSRNFLRGDQVFDPGGVSNVFAAIRPRAWLVWCLAEVGRFADAMEYAREALRIAEAANDPSSLVYSSRSVGLVHLRRGEIDRALPALERAAEVRRSAHLPALFDITASFLGYAYALAGRLAEAVPLLERAVTDPASTGRANHPLLLAHLAEAHLLAGDPDRACAVAQEALALAQRQQESGNEAWVLHLLGGIAAHGDPPNADAARRHYASALARSEELGMRPLQAHCHFGLGRLFLRTGKHTQAQEHLLRAVTMYRELDMGSWLARAEAAVEEPGPVGGAGAGHRICGGGAG
jgi:class 3 adenylate cyclase/tetratricopeptide (TPR) repeat protein